MKKTITTLSVAMFTLACFSGYAGGNNNDGVKETKTTDVLSTTAETGMAGEMMEGGFFFHIGGIFPSRTYMFPLPVESSDVDVKFGTGLEFDAGSMFLISDIDPMAIGLRATWFTAGYSVMKEDSVLMRSIQASPLRFGPYFSYAISDLMVVDAYYQIGAQYNVLFDHDWGTDYVWGSGSGNVGATHEVGVSYRLDKLSVGFGYRFGRMVDVEHMGENDPDIKAWYQSRPNHLRVFIGVRL